MIPVRPVSLRDHQQLGELAGGSISRVRLVMNQWPGQTRRMWVFECGGQGRGFIRVRIVRRGHHSRQAWGQRLVAWLGSSTRPQPDSLIQLLRLGLIEQLVVNPAWRWQGIGAALVESASDWLQSQAVSELQLMLGTEALAVKPFCQYLGFQPRQLLLYKQLDAQEPPPTSAIRPATPADLPQLATLVSQEIQQQQQVAHSFHLRPHIDWAAYTAACLGDPATQLLVAVQEERLVGYIDLHCVQPGQQNLRTWLARMARTITAERQRPSPFGVIEDVYVLPEVRRQGLARALVQQGSDWFRRRQIGAIQAAVWADNAPSLRFFEHLGFTWRTQLMSKRL